MRVRLAVIALAGVLLLSSIITSGLCAWYVWSSRQNLMVQAEVARLNMLGAAIRSLLGDSIDYGKRNPTIVPLLQSWKVLPATPAPVTPPAGGGPAPRTSPK